MRRLPAEDPARLVVQDRIVQAGERGQETEILRRVLVGDALGLDPELARDRLRDQLSRDAQVAHAVEGRSGGRLLDSEAVEDADVVSVGRRPTVRTIADIRGGAVLTSEPDQRMGEAVVIEV